MERRPDCSLEAFYHQYFMIFRSFIETATTITDHTQTNRTFHAHSDLDDFLSLAAYLTWRTVEKAIDRNTPDGDSGLVTLSSSLEIMRSALTDDVGPSPHVAGENRDYLFCCAILYFNRLWEERPHSRYGTVNGAFDTDGMQDPAVLSALCALLDEFQEDVLHSYEATLDVAQFIRVYGDLISAGMLLMNVGEERSFQRHFTWKAGWQDSQNTWTNVEKAHSVRSISPAIDGNHDGDSRCRQEIRYEYTLAADRFV
jgi:hypothetical protein